MLSILIPVYNYDVRAFVKELNNQCLEAKIEFEILCFDDHSKEYFIRLNREITGLSNVSLKELSQNVGRSKIRNWLAREAKYQYLLFLDCDSQTSSKTFIQNYLDYLHPNQLLYGGRSYEKSKPKNKSQILRWKYGAERECSSAIERSKSPYKSFMTNNFLIPKGIFTAIKLDESIKGYGHEDTLFGLELKKWKIPIEHVENPLIHLGLEPSDEFLSKTLEGISNLHSLNVKRLVIEDVKLLKYSSKLKKIGLRRIFYLLFKKFEPNLLKNLKSSNPNLKKFDLWKLGKFIELDYKNLS